MVTPDPWHLRDPLADDPSAAASLLTVANGWVGVRGALDEQTPAVHQATLVAGVHEVVPLEHGEEAYGYPSTQERALAVPDGWAVHLEVDGAPLDVRTGTVTQHQRVLALRTGTLSRTLRWAAPTGATVEVTSSRYASLARPELVVVRYAVRVLDDAARGAVEVRLGLFPCCDASPLRAGSGDPHDGDRHVPDDGSDARTRQACEHTGTRAWTVQHVPSSEVGVVVMADVEVSGGTVAGEAHTTEVTARLAPGDALDLDLLVAFTASRDAADDELVRRATQVLDDARAAGAEALDREHRDVLEGVWCWADVEVDGDPELQQAVRLGILHVVQSAANLLTGGLRAKGLSGTGYLGHTFWDADTYVLPLLSHVLPDAARAHLRWRHSTLPVALDHARTLGLAGAAFAWRTVTGPESSGYWPASSAALHIAADVADAVVRHVAVTGDTALESEVGVDLVVQTARLWLSAGHHTDDGAFHVHGVTGPDEYSALVDDNAYTNLMARRNLRAAVDLVGRHPDAAQRLGVGPDEVAAWTRAADAMAVPYDEDRGVTQQHAGFTGHGPWDFAATCPHEYPLEDHHTYRELYRRRVVKQADVVLAHWLASDASTEQKRRDLAYYEPLTVRDSSLSAPAQAVVTAEVGHLRAAHDLVRETALLDLHDLDGNVHEGLHVASLAGTWSGLVAGFGGLRSGDGRLRLAPRLPATLGGLRFGVRHGGARVRVEVTPEKATYHLLDAGPVELHHHGERLVLTGDEPTAVRAVPPLGDVPDAPAQPPGRPLRRPFPG
ncbi:glycoside hydrolase family 65 protein [Cellulomonas carbonis]|uniref:Glycosyl hydrolase n=1 Tax=Cellulomonas carbonis T26 TaxID=947969 RepID=A0A0A0BWQ0_9CELL|nr:glycosyl hydrolase family 65 protein [Cellulomonas carbonis]KGM12400.1 glycosyl hydrolase [Cellulomonas carbonis T26]